MDFDYLDEIKIEKKTHLPAVQGEKSLRKQSSKEDLIKLLRSKSYAQEAETPLSLKDIELYKQAMALEKKRAEEKKVSSKEKKQTVEIPNKEPVSAIEETVSAIKKETTVAMQKEKNLPVTEDSFADNRISEKDGIFRSNILVKYLCKELLMYFAICFCLFFVAFFVNNILLLAETILRQHVKVSAVLRLILYCLPSIVAQSAPFATLVGFLMCLGRMVTDNEIMILRATGQRYSLILIPVLLMGLLISIFSFVMNDYFLPLGILKFNRLKHQIVQSDPAVEIEGNSVKRMNGTTVVIGDVSDDKVIQNIVFFNTDGDGNDRIIVSTKGSVEKTQDEGVLMKFNMGKTSVFSIDTSDRRTFDVLESQNASFNVFDTIITDAKSGIDPREKTSFDLWKQIRQMSTDQSVTKKRLNQYKLEFNKKFSMPFGSLFFAMLAFPLALVFGKRDGLTLGLIFGIIISVLYWAASILGQIFGVKSGWNGFVMMWTPNVVIGIIGIILYMGLRKK